VTEIQGSLIGVSTDVGKVLHRQHDQEQQAILAWLTPVDYFAQQNDYFDRRLENGF
jgi:hypothetical protein